MSGALFLILEYYFVNELQLHMAIVGYYTIIEITVNISYEKSDPRTAYVHKLLLILFVSM
jgi:hypothetical protein